MAIRRLAIPGLLIGFAACSAEAPAPSAHVGSAADTDRLFIVGQDLDSIRDYVGSGCCVAADGATAYVDFYNVRVADGGFGGLGLDVDAAPIELESDWGAGPVNAWKTATEFGFDWVAIGLSLTENNHPGGLDRIVAGDHDAEIRQLAAFANHYDGSILLRIGYEFDGFWNQGYADAARYVLAYRRIVDGLRDAGVSNVQYVWQGAASTTDAVLDRGVHDNIADWYPGDEYVDWLGLSWFMHPDEVAGVPLAFDVPTPRELGDEILALARTVDKPVLIAEASPQGFDLRDRTHAHHVAIWDGPAGETVGSLSDAELWDAWFQPMFDYMNANADVIRGLAYINARWDDQPMWAAPYASGYWGDSRLEANTVIASRFSDAVIEWRARQ